MGRKGKSLRKRSHGTRNAIVALAIILAAVAAAVYVAAEPNGGGSVTVVAGADAPPFAIRATNGTTFSLGNYVGKSDVLLFFNEGLMCSPCLQQMVDIERNYSAFSGMGILVVSITADPASSLGAWASDNGVTKMMILSDPSLQVDQEYDTLYAGSMHPGMTPGHTFILIDRAGRVIWREDYGYRTMYVPLNELLSSLRAVAG